MKTLTARKLVAIFTAVSLAFLQAVPAGVAATKPVEEITGTGVPTSEKPVAETSTQQVPAVAAPQTSTDFLSTPSTLSKPSRTPTAVTEPHKPIDDIKPPVEAVQPPVISHQQQYVAAQLGVKPEDITNFVYTPSKEEDINKPCKGPGCVVSVGYVSFDVNGVSYVGRIEQDRLRPIRVDLIQTDLKVEDVKAIAANLEIRFGDIAKIDSKNMPVCKALYKCPVFSAQLEVELKNGEFYSGTLSKYENREGRVTYQVDLKKSYPPAVRGYLAYLQGLFPGYSIKVKISPNLCKMGPCPQAYVFTVFNPDATVNPGQLRTLTIRMVDGQKSLPTVTSAEFDEIGKIEDVALLYAGLAKLSDKPMELFAKIRVTSVDKNGIHFDLLQKPSTSYRIYRNVDGTVVLEKEQKLPPAVEKLVSTLQEKIGGGFKVTAALQKDGSYLIVVTDAKVYAKAPTSGLHQISIRVSQSGGIDTSSIEAVYYGPSGDIKVNGALLYEAMGVVCLDGQACKANIYPADPIERLLKMTQISFVGISGDAIFYKLGDAYYKAYKASNGQVHVAQKFPSTLPAVEIVQEPLDQAVKLQAQAAELLAQAEANPYSSIELVKEAQSLMGQALALLPSSSELKDLSALAAALQAESRDLLVLARLSPPDAAKIKNEAYSMMDSVRQIAAFSQETQAVLAKNANLQAQAAKILEEIKAAQAFVDELQAALGKDYVVSIGRENPYKISIDFRTHPDCSPEGPCLAVIFVPKPGQITHISFMLSTDGVLDPKSLEVSYAVDASLSKAVDAQLLYEAMGVCPQGLVCSMQAISQIGLLAKMAQISVTKVENGVIFYALGGTNYKTYRDKTGKVIVEKTISPELLAQAQAILGSGVVSGVLLKPDSSTDAPQVYEFYDANGTKLGFVSINVAKGSDQAWTNAQGQLVAKVKADGSKTLYEYDSIGRLTLSKDFNSEGVLISTNQYEYKDILPMEILQAAVPILSAAEKEQLFAAMLDAGANSQYSLQIDETNGTKSWIWTSADGKTTYVLAQSKDRIPVGTPDENGNYTQFEETIRWNFSAQSKVGIEEVRAYAQAMQDIEQRQQLLAALAQAEATGVKEFTKTVSGSEVSYSWGGTKDDRPATYVISVGPNGELNFSIQIRLNPNQVLQMMLLDKSSLLRIVETDTAMPADIKAQAIEAINAAPENTVFLRTVAENGDVTVQWLDVNDPNKTYVIGADDNALSFSIQVRLNPNQVLQMMLLDKSSLLRIVETDTAMPADIKAQAIEAINAAPENTVFLRTVAENGDVTVQWLDANDPNKTYTIGADNDGLNFSIQIKVDQQEVIPELIEQAILQVAAAQKRLEEAQKALERAGANVEAALAELKAAEQMKAEAEQMLQMAQKLQEAAQAASDHASDLEQAAQNQINAAMADQKAAEAEQAKIDKLQNMINLASKCIGGNIDVCKANGWPVLKDPSGKWYVPDSTKNMLQKNINAWRADQAAAAKRMENYFRSASEHYKKARDYTVQSREMYLKANEYLTQSSNYQKEGQALLAKALERIKAGQIRLQVAQQALQRAKQNYLNATTAFRAAVERLQRLPGYQEALVAAQAAVAEAQNKLAEAQKVLDQANQRVEAALAELKAAEQMKAEAEQMLQMAQKLQEMAAAATNQANHLSRLAESEVNAAASDQKAAEAEQAKIDKLQKNYIDPARQCIGGNVDACKAHGWPVARDSSGKWYVPESTKKDLAQNIAVWTRYQAAAAQKKAAYLKSASEHYKRAKAYTVQAKEMYQAAKDYLAKSAYYQKKGQSLLTEASKRIKESQTRLQAAQQGLAAARQNHLNATAAFRAAVERLEMLQPKISVMLEVVA